MRVRVVGMASLFSGRKSVNVSYDNFDAYA